MPKPRKTALAPPSACSCGPLKPQSGDEAIAEGTQPQAVLAKVMLLCDDQTGVFFFRYNQQLYLRVIKAEC